MKHPNFYNGLRWGKPVEKLWWKFKRRTGVAVGIVGGVCLLTGFLGWAFFAGALNSVYAPNPKKPL